jgi:hypothetical protein
MIRGFSRNKAAAAQPTQRVPRPQKTMVRPTGTAGGVIGWLVMSFLLVAALLVLGGIFFVHSIKVHQSGAGNDVQVETPFGSVHVGHNQGGRPGTGGMPLYPGAKPLKNQENAVVDLSSAFGDQDLHVVAGRWETSDPIDKVQKYYEDKFPDMNVIQHAGRVEMHSVNGNATRVIVLYDRGSSTEISLASVGEPKAN